MEIAVANLSKKHSGKPAYKEFYSLVKRTYQDDGEKVTEDFALDKEALEVFGNQNHGYLNR